MTAHLSPLKRTPAPKRTPKAIAKYTKIEAKQSKEAIFKIGKHSIFKPFKK
ncbi:MAG: hypothetical protein WC390_10865 [Sulfurimonas sp.]